MKRPRQRSRLDRQAEAYKAAPKLGEMPEHIIDPEPADQTIIEPKLFTFVPVEDDELRVNVHGPDGELICWLPVGAADVVKNAYDKMRRVDWVVAGEWMKGVLLGVHASIFFGNNRPVVTMSHTKDTTTFRMHDLMEDDV